MTGEVKGEGRSAADRPSSHEGGALQPWAPMDAALAAYRAGDREASLVMETDVGGAEEVPAALFFRSPEEMGPVERSALELASGRVLDLGAGAGAHAVPLSRRGLEVTAVEVLASGRAAMREAGVGDVRDGGLEGVGAEERFDTVLVLMNGLGLAGTLSALPGFLQRLAALLDPGGRILADSTDPRGWDDEGDGRYPGEVHMRLRCGTLSGPPFPFLFVHEEAVRAAAQEVGLEATVVAREEDGRFLVSLRREGPGPA